MPNVKQFTQKYNALPMPVQIAGYGVGLILLYKVYKTIFKTQQQQTNAEIVKEAEKELQTYLKNTKLTYPPSNYGTFANTIYEGMKYGVGDDYGNVADTLKKLKNNADVAFLQKVYGSRQHYIFGIPTGEPKDLFTAVRSELGSEYGGLTSYRVKSINEDWKKKGIKYQF